MLTRVSAAVLVVLLVVGATWWGFASTTEMPESPRVLAPTAEAAVDDVAPGAAPSAEGALAVVRAPEPLVAESLAVETPRVGAEPVTLLRIGGVVHDEAGAPIADARIEVSPGRDASEPALVTTSDADGCFELPAFAVRPGELSILKAGWVPQSAGLPRPRANGAPTRIDATLLRATTLRGVLRWKDGEPCARAHLEVRPALAGAWNTGGAPTLAETDTGEDGRFAIVDLAVRQIVQLKASVDGYEPRYPFTLELSAEPEQEATLELNRPATLRLVFDDLAARTDISPEAKARLAVTLFTQDTSDIVARTVRGDATLPFTRLDPAVAYAPYVSVPGFESKWLAARVTLHAGDNTWHGTLGELTPEPPAEAVEPRRHWSFDWSFVDEQQQAITGAEAGARWTAGRLRSYLKLQARSLETGEEEAVVIDASRGEFSRNEGTCDVRVPPPIEISVVLNGTRQVLAPIVPDQKVLIVVPVPAGVARVDFVARTADGEPEFMPGLHIQRTGIEDEILLPQDFSVPEPHVWLLPGDYVASTFGGEYASSTAAFTVVGDAPRTVELLLHHGGMLRGHVQLPGEFTAQLVQLHVSDAALDAAWSFATLRADGSFEFAGLAPGECVVTLLAHDELTDAAVVTSQPATIISDRVTDVRLDLVAPTSGTAELLVRLTASEEGMLALSAPDGSLALAIFLKRGKDQRLRLPAGTIRYRLSTDDGAVEGSGSAANSGKGAAIAAASPARTPRSGELELAAARGVVTLEF